MKTADAREYSALRKLAQRTDFLFAGLGVLPVALFLGGHPDAAILLFVPLLIVACLGGAWEQAQEEPAQSARTETAAVTERAASGLAPRLIMRDRLPPGES